MSDLSFTHLDPLGRARMVDVTPKEPTHRRAVARCKVFMKPETTAAIANREVKKGDVLSVARVAGIQAAKRTSDMIPLCHPLLVGAVSVNFEIGDDFVAIEVHVDTVDRTGVEMEALHACSIAALTVYDMCKSADRGMVIGELALWEKTGGRLPSQWSSDRRGRRRWERCRRRCGDVTDVSRMIALFVTIVVESSHNDPAAPAVALRTSTYRHHTLIAPTTH
jgi:cyclic pyranopterin phosphate synthase